MKKHHRRKGHNPQAGVRVGVAWYTRESWEQLRQLASDPELLEPTYEEWVEMAERSLSQVHAAGMHPERIELNIGRLAEWCREKKRPVDAAARAEFTAQNLRAKHEDPHKTGSV